MQARLRSAVACSDVPLAQLCWRHMHEHGLHQVAPSLASPAPRHFAHHPWARPSLATVALHARASCEMVRWLLRVLPPTQWAVVDAEGNHVALLAAYLGWDALMLLESFAATANDAGQTSLHLAAMGGNTHTVQFLLHSQVDVNERDAQGNRALHYAAAWGHQDVVALLAPLTSTDGRLRNYSGSTPSDVVYDDRTLYLLPSTSSPDVPPLERAPGPSGTSACENRYKLSHCSSSVRSHFWPRRTPHPPHVSFKKFPALGRRVSPRTAPPPRDDLSPDAMWRESGVVAQRCQNQDLGPGPGQVQGQGHATGLGAGVGGGKCRRLRLSLINPTLTPSTTSPHPSASTSTSSGPSWSPLLSPLSPASFTSK